jgi:hypothetical protein
MISDMFIAYAGMALFIVFGIYAIFTSMRHKDGKHDWVPTRTGAIIGGLAIILFVIAGLWALLQSLIP